MARLAVRRRDREHHGVRPADRQRRRRAGAHHRLRQQPLRDAAADADAGDHPHQAGAEAAAGRAAGPRAPAGGGAAEPAHDLRYRDDGDDRLLQRDRELLPLPHGPRAGRAAADLLRIPARERAADRRREPRHRAADRRHVARRCGAQNGALRVRLPPAELRRQPAADLRGVGAVPAADRVRLGDAGAVGDGAHRRHLRRAGHPPDRPHRPDRRNPARGQAGGRSARRSAAGARCRAAACW